ncbi:MAG: 2-phospho-L-lactate guanylyltransferase [Streptosporangiaceae bacterium]|jgi:2-phospho-L-lactate guanylyltransferase
MDDPLPWSIVIPVKVLARAKSRLAPLAGPRRPELALAMAADTVAAAVACGAGIVIVVTGDAAAAAELSGLGALVLPDEPDTGLNQALVFGAAHAADRWPSRGRAALAADLPALKPAELGGALAAAASMAEAFVADAAGTGTTLYMAGPDAAFRPKFGPGSRDRHRLGGAVQLDLDAGSGLRRDVDTPADLRLAAQIGLGPRTAALAAQLAGR